MGDVGFWLFVVGFGVMALLWLLWNVYALVQPHQGRMQRDLSRLSAERDRARRNRRAAK